jgi:hypothetical protein
MHSLMRRLERLEVDSTASVIDAWHIFVHFIGSEPWSPTWARVKGSPAIYRREDETPEQFQTRAARHFPAKPIAVIWMGAA